MVEPRYRSKSMRKVFTKTPGGRLATHFKKRKPSKAVCAVCGKDLAAVPNERPYKMENMPKTKKRPERAYGGVMCSKCSARKIISDVRENTKSEDESEN